MKEVLTLKIATKLTKYQGIILKMYKVLMENKLSLPDTKTLWRKTKWKGGFPYWVVDLIIISSSLYILDRSLLSDIHVCYLCYLVIFLMASWKSQGFFILINFNFQFFFILMVHALPAIPKKLCLSQDCKDVLLCFLLEALEF